MWEKPPSLPTEQGAPALQPQVYFLVHRLWLSARLSSPIGRGEKGERAMPMVRTEGVEITPEVRGGAIGNWHTRA